MPDVPRTRWLASSRSGGLTNILLKPATFVATRIFDSHIVPLLQEFGLSGESITSLRTALTTVSPKKWGREIKSLLPTLFQQSASTVIKKHLPSAVDQIIAFVEKRLTTLQKRSGQITENEVLNFVGDLKVPTSRARPRVRT